jgi:hypothetical protein
VLFAVALAGAAARAVSSDGRDRWAYLRHYHEVVDCKRHLETPRRFTGHKRFDTLSPEQVLADCEGFAREMAEDLRGGRMDFGARRETMSKLATLGRAARPAVPELLAALEEYRDDPSEVTRVSWFCRAAEALGAADPKNPAVIRALADALDREPRSSRTCHRCGCALEALARAGPAAAPIAGPVLERLAARQPPLITTYRGQLGKAIEAIGLGPASSGAVLESLRATGQNRALPDDRAANMRALARNAEQLSPADLEALAQVAAAQLGEGYAPLRISGAEVLGRIGRLDLLEPALRDPHYEVRRAALDGLAAAGRRAVRFLDPMLSALDPFLGTTEAAARALVASGRGVAFEVELRGTGAPERLRPLYEASARAVLRGDVTPVQEALARGFRKGPHGKGYVEIETLAKGIGTRYDPRVHRIQVEVWGGVYGPGREKAQRIEGLITAENWTYTTFFLALAGRQKGERLRILMSPEVADSPFDHSRYSGGRLPPGAAGEFEVEIRKVCRPQIWEILEGGGIIGPWRIEIGCK